MANGNGNATNQAGQGGPTIGVKFVPVGKRPFLVQVAEGTTLGQLLVAQGCEKMEASIDNEICRDLNRVLKVNDAVILKQKLEAGQ